MTRGGSLLGQVGQQVVGRPLVQAGGEDAGPGVRRRQGAELPGERTERAAELHRAARRVALPERELARLPRCRSHEHPVVGDVLDPPRGRAESEDVADPRLVDHLLVQLAHPGTAATGGRLVGPGQEDAEQATVRDRPAAGHREPLSAGAPGDRTGHPVPDHSGPQLGELVRRVAPGQHVQHRLVRRPRQPGVRRGPAHDVVQPLDVPLLDADHGDDLLGQHVQGVSRVAERLDVTVAHPLGDHGGLHEVAAVLREDHALGHCADLVAGPPDALQPAGHGWR